MKAYCTYSFSISVLLFAQTSYDVCRYYLFYLSMIFHCTNAIIYLPVCLLLDLLDISKVFCLFNVTLETVVLTMFKAIHFSSHIK